MISDDKLIVNGHCVHPIIGEPTLTSNPPQVPHKCCWCNYTGWIVIHSSGKPVDGHGPYGPTSDAVFAMGNLKDDCPDSSR